VEANEVMIIIISIVYSLSLLYIFLFSLGQLHLTLIYIKEARKKAVPIPVLTNFPLVTVQLPVYNEKYVIERLLDAVSKLDYPKDRLEIQVLDDSTDETSELIRIKLLSPQHQGLNIHIIHRNDRTGYKAGALAHGLKSSKGEFIAIFDADFIPESDFLLKTLPHFTNNNVGVVQTRWGHI
jgi:cellulose synthase/poly-beta-1,6-N-acetylglucosamine synthase-like glycosyltransferase